jgi:hypothetical protein
LPRLFWVVPQSSGWTPDCLRIHIQVFQFTRLSQKVLPLGSRIKRRDQDSGLGIFLRCDAIGQLQSIRASCARNSASLRLISSRKARAASRPRWSAARAASRLPRSTSARACTRITASSGRSFLSRASCPLSSMSWSAAAPRYAGISSTAIWAAPSFSSTARSGTTGTPFTSAMRPISSWKTLRKPSSSRLMETFGCRSARTAVIVPARLERLALRAHVLDAGPAHSPAPIPPAGPLSPGFRWPGLFLSAV